MDAEDAIIQPRKGSRSPRLGPVAVLAAADADLNLLRGLLGFGADDGRRLFISRLYTVSAYRDRICLVGPMVGAPYAAMTAETLIAWGTRVIIFLGWCGAISESVDIGDGVLPTSAYIEEGTSRIYLPSTAESAPSASLVQKMADACASEGVRIHQGPVWTTDAVYRETRDKVSGYQRQGVLAVEMETSALFTIGAFRAVDVAAFLVVSDDLSRLSWQPGFKDPRFTSGRQAACRVIAKLCETLAS
jgi:uridine phosphorylase